VSEPLHLGKNQDLGTDIGSLPSVMALALGKEARFAECHTKYSPKDLTWGPSLADSLMSVLGGTRQMWILCRVLSGRHSAKVTPLPSVTGALGKDAVSVTRRRNGCFSLPSAREKVLGKEGFADALCAEPSLPSATLGKA
jgi:hypothetical protein